MQSVETSSPSLLVSDTHTHRKLMLPHRYSADLSLIQTTGSETGEERQGQGHRVVFKDLEHALSV